MPSTPNPEKPSFTPSEQYQKIRLIIIPILCFLILPIMAIIIWWITPASNYFFSIFKNFWLSFVLGGSFFIGAKIWEIYEIKFIIFKKKQWKKRPGKGRVFYKISYPATHNPPLANMVGFLGSLHSMFPGIRSKADSLNFGKGYYDFAFDIFIRQKKVDIFIAVPEEKCNILKTALGAYYPNIKFVKCDNPYQNWPEKWSKKNGLGKFKDLWGTDYKLDQSGPYPLANPESLNSDPSPMTKLLHSFMDNDPEALYVLQYLVRPFENNKAEKWAKILEEKKKEILSKNSMFIGKSGDGKSVESTSTNLITETQKEMFGECDAKMNQPHFKSHLRLVAFFESGKEFVGDLTENDFKVFQGDTAGNLQALEKNQSSATNPKFSKSKFEYFDGFIAPLAEQFYYPKERQYRKQQIYAGLVGRDLDAPTDSGELLIDVKSLSSILHFPDGKLLNPEQSLTKLKLVN